MLSILIVKVEKRNLSKLISIQQHACQQRFSVEIYQNDGFSTADVKRWREETPCQAVWHRKQPCQTMLAPGANPPGSGDVQETKRGTD
jgi:hypothetical protein